MNSFEHGDVGRAQELQEVTRRFTAIYHRYGGGPHVAKAVMRMTGIDCGPVRLPLRTLSEENFQKMKKEVEQSGIDPFFMRVDKAPGTGAR
jgi:N-acetylneuraminate lyase